MSTITRETLVPTDWVLYIEVRRGIGVGIPTGDDQHDREQSPDRQGYGDEETQVWSLMIP